MTKSTLSKRKGSAAESSSKTFVFYIIACSIPLIFFLAFEGALRLVAYGDDVPLFIDNPANPHYILPRPDVMTRYFPDNAAKPNVTLEANFLLKEKPENGVRIFVQGGSTAAGFPYGYGASLAATLDQRLKQTLIGKHVEVVGTALSAVNSYTLLDFAGEIIDQRPDAVLIYAGHNEFLGILGVGSNYGMSTARHTTLWFLSLKNWRVFQLIQEMFFATQSTNTGDASNNSTDAPRTLMAQIAKQKHIEYSDETFDAGLKQFERNMRRLIDKYRKAGIPVFIGTLASNQKDQPPFSSLTASEEHTDLFARMKAQKSSLTNSKETQAQWQKASEVLQTSRSADLQYAVAQELEKQGLFALAKQHYLLATEHDLLRFRAPLAINDIIRQIAQDSGVVLVDTLASFEQRSANGIIGNNLMLEHLHPNLQGYFVLSESFYQALRASQLFSSWQHVSIEKAWQQRLVLPAEEYYAFATIQKLLSDYPFTDTPQPYLLPAPADWQQEAGKAWFEKRTDWQSMMQSSLIRYQNDKNTEMVLKTLQILADALPHNGLYNVQLAEAMLSRQRYNEALHYFRRAKLAGALGKDIDLNIESIENILATDS